ncbi:hypothetical protein [Haloarchaeobius sp. TZWWS8]|uniref:hypothetical protein n=1 Tax=Haloarchaeobius sp. TZWWS8 TaxID=3446121 RepID=UPI003EBF421B
MSEAFLGAVRKTAPGLLLTVAVLVGGQLLDVSASLRYGAGLVAFTLWMGWFVITFVHWFEWRED